MKSSNTLLPLIHSPVAKNDDFKTKYESPSFRHTTDNLLVNIDEDDLLELKKYFFPNIINNSDTSEKFKHLDYPVAGISLSKEEFVNAIEQIFGKEHLNKSASLYFEELQQKNKVKDSINWSQFIDSIIEQYKIKIEKCDVNVQNFLQIENRFTLSNAKDPILQMLMLETAKTFCFVVINYTGSIQVYSNKMTLHHSYSIPLSPGLMRRSIWISSACSSADGTHILITTSDRYLYIYDTKWLLHTLKFVISGLPNVISCQQFNAFFYNGKSLLLLGDDSGNIHFLLFHQPSKSFFKESQDKEITKYKWTDIKKQDQWVSLTTDLNVHKDYIMAIFYIQENDTVISCSPDPLASIVVKKREGHLLLYVTKLKKNLKCFDLDTNLGFLATSASETFVSLWNSSTPTSSIIQLRSHDKNIVNINFISQIYSVLSLSEDGVLKVWSLNNFKCLQNIVIDHFSLREIYFRHQKIIRRYTEKIRNSHEFSRLPNKNTSVQCIYIVNGSEIIKLNFTNIKDDEEEKQLPAKNLQPAIPGLDIIFKNYNREHPFELKKIFHDRRIINDMDEEKSFKDKRFFIKNGGVYLVLKCLDINEDFINKLYNPIQVKDEPF